MKYFFTGIAHKNICAVYVLSKPLICHLKQLSCHLFKIDRDVTAFGKIKGPNVPSEQYGSQGNLPFVIVMAAVAYLDSI